MNAKQIVSALGGVVLLSASAAVFADANGGRSAENAPVGSLNTTSASPLCRAAINSDGTIAGGGGTLTSAARIGVGQYEVIWKGRCTTVTAANGYTSWVQPHTLTIGSSNAYCTAADRAGNPNGTWVACYGAGGAAADTSFFIKVER